MSENYQNKLKNYKVYNAKERVENSTTHQISVDGEIEDIKKYPTSRIEEILTYDDDNDYKRALFYNGSQAMKFMESLARRRSREILSIVNVGVFKNDVWDEKLSKYLLEEYWEKNEVLYYLTLASDKSFLEGKSALTLLPYEGEIALNVPTSISIIVINGNVLESLTVAQSFTKGSFNYTDLYTYETELKIRKGFASTTFKKIDKQGNKLNSTKKTYVERTHQTAIPKFTNIPKDLMPAIYIEEYPTDQRLGVSKLEQIGKMLDIYEMLHIEKYLYIENNGNRVESDYVGSADQEKKMRKNIAKAKRENYITLLGANDDDEVEQVIEILADYSQLEELDGAIGTMEKIMTSRIGISSKFDKNGTFNSTEKEVDMSVDEPSSNAQQKQDATKWDKIIRSTLYKMIALKRDKKLNGVEIRAEILPTDYKLLALVSEKSEKLIADGVYSPEEIRAITSGMASWIAKKRVEDNFKLLAERKKMFDPEPEVKKEENNGN